MAKTTPAAPVVPVAPSPWAPVPTGAQVAEGAAPEAPVVTAPEAPIAPAAPEVPAVIAEPILEVAGELVDMVTVTAPKAFKLRVDNFRELDIKAGVQQMERALAEHWYSVANGVTIYDPK